MLKGRIVECRVMRRFLPEDSSPPLTPHPHPLLTHPHPPVSLLSALRPCGYQHQMKMLSSACLSARAITVSWPEWRVFVIKHLSRPSLDNIVRSVC